MDYKEWLGLFGVALNIVGYVPYYAGIFRGKVHPHMFSWIIWSLLSFIGVAAQVAGGAGPGAWTLGASLFLSAGIMLLSFKYGEKTITRGDRIAFIAGLSAIPLWLVTKDPAWSVILITIIDVVAFFPTFRKSWTKPREEAVTMYAFSGIKFIFALAALTQINIATALYPASLVMMNGLFVAVALLRRRAYG